MDFLQFIPSKTVADYVLQSGYELTAMDAACIVHNSRKTISEKHKAYREIIDTMPDCEIPRCENMLHDTLHKLIAFEDSRIAVVNEIKDASVTVDLPFGIYDGISGTNKKILMNTETGRYTDIASCMRAIQDLPKECFVEDKPLRVSIVLPNERYEKYSLVVNCNQEIIAVSEMHNFDDNFNADNDLDYALQCLELNKNFPLPLKDGDVLIINDIYGTSPIKAVYVNYNNRHCMYRDISEYMFDEMRAEQVIYADYAKEADLDERDGIQYKTIAALLKGKINLGEFIKVYHYLQAVQYNSEFLSKKSIKKLGIKFDIKLK